jgi:hypothetical protein
MSYKFVDSFRAGPGLYIPLLSVQWINSWWWTDELSETFRVLCQNKFVKLVHLVGFITRKSVTMHGHMNVKFCWTVWPWRWRHMDPSKRSVSIYQYTWRHIFGKVAVWTSYIANIQRNQTFASCCLYRDHTRTLGTAPAMIYLDNKPRCADGEDIAPTRRSCITLLWFGVLRGFAAPYVGKYALSSRPTCCLLYCLEDERVLGKIRTCIPDYTRHCSKYRDCHIVFSSLTISNLFFYKQTERWSCSRALKPHLEHVLANGAHPTDCDVRNIIV